MNLVIGTDNTITGLDPEREALLLLLDGETQIAHVLARRLSKCGWRNDGYSAARLLAGLVDMQLVATASHRGGLFYSLTERGVEVVEAIRQGSEIGV